MNTYNMGVMYNTDYLAQVYPYNTMPAMPVGYGSPVSSFPTGFYPDNSLCKSDNDTSPSTSNEIDEQKKKQLSPEEYAKWRTKREKNNEAAKMSRKKRTDREKTYSQQLQLKDEEIRRMNETIKELQATVAQYTLVIQQNQEENSRLQMELQRYQQQQQNVDILGDKTNSIADSKPYVYPQYQPYL